MIAALLLFLAGMLASAFFSGSETGFYRVTRIKLLMKSLRGDKISNFLIWQINHPSVFVATVLVGNNVANYLTSAAVVMGTEHLLTGETSYYTEIVLPLLFTPFIFIYGELLPKTLFYDAPNRLLRRSGPVLLIVSVLFAPVTAILWIVSRIIQILVHKTPEEMSTLLARHELFEVLEEGHEAGILYPIQQSLVQGLLNLGPQSIEPYLTPLGRFPVLHQKMSRKEILNLGKRQHHGMFPVKNKHSKASPETYVRMVDFALQKENTWPEPRPLVTINHDATFLTALNLLWASEGLSLGKVVGPNGKTIGYVTAKELTQQLLAHR